MTVSRLVAFATSRQQLVASSLAILGALLALLDPVGVPAVVLVLGFYAVGLAAAQASARPPFTFDPVCAGSALQEQLASVSDRLPPEVLGQLYRIKDMIRIQVLPGIEMLPLGSLDRYLAERTTVEYLPSAVTHYLAAGDFGDSSAATAAAARILSDELCLMEADMRRIAAVIQQTNLDRMRAHRRFLSERFQAVEPSG
ncbi:MAG TPA: hypothetical protein VIT43_09070 [Candidatus Dormibacteraeota bacterium]